MKFNININQKSIIESGLEIDLFDASILDHIIFFSHSSEINKLSYKGHLYFWFSHSNIIDALPLLKLKKDSIYRRMKNLCELNLLESHPDCKSLGRSYYRITDLALKLYYGNKSEPTDINPMGYGYKSDGGTDINPMDNNIINNNINNNNSNESAEIFPRLIPIKEKFATIAFSKIKNFKEFYSEFEYNKKYLRIAYRFWKLRQIENPSHKSLKDAKLVQWYDAIRLIVEVDKQSIDRLIAVYKYFEKCSEQTKGFDPFWFKTLKSVSSIRHTDKNGEYRLDKLIDIVNEKTEKDDKFYKELNESIKNFNL